MPIYALTDPTFQPAMRIIQDITAANPALVITTFPHDYVTGEIVRLLVPDGFGMVQVNNMQGKITVNGATTFTIDIDTTRFDDFEVPMGATQQAQVVPIGEDNAILTAATNNVLT